MSARLVKKVLNEKHLSQQFIVEEEEEEDEDQLNDSTNRSSINPFDLLNDHDSDPEYQEEELESAKETLTRYDDKEEPSSLKNTAAVKTSNSKSKKKKKKKNKDGSVANKMGGGKELDSIIEDLSLDGISSSEQHVSSKVRAVSAKDQNKSVNPHASSVLQVDPKYLNAENELRRIFGSKVVKSFETQTSNQASSSRQIRGVRRGHYNLRKTVLVTPANHWPRWDGSLSMEFLETKNGYNYFKYSHSSSYSQAQSAFEATKAINDLNGIASILMHHPYHLDSLLTMAEYFKVVGEQQMSADAIAKCLYALECAWNPMFTPLQGNCQLKFNHDTNKPMFTGLFTHMKNLDRRGCHRSALEVCKLLLSLDSDDPMGAIFCLDYFALRAEEYAWLENFAENYQSDNSIWLFPNFSYSLAICRFYLERETSKDACIDAKKSSSLDLMKQALMLHPSVIKKLVEKVPLKDRTWTDILKHAFFRSDQTRIVSQDHLISIYVERSYLIWRLPDLQKLLSDAAQLVLETLENNKSEVKDWACAREVAFSSEKNEYGHLLVSDFSDSVASIPAENLQQFMGPPGMREGMLDENQFANLQVHGNGNGQAPRGVANRNALAVLFESMLPWVTYEDREDGEHDGNQHDDDHGPNNQ